ncbi:hypothetical protein JHK84_039751 [Glycine max]|nr:hypothetical protein JHK84_039751 [Glycine max]
MAHVRGYQVRRHYKVIWAVGILDKVVLRWRRKGASLRGFQQEMEINENENEDEDILKNPSFELPKSRNGALREHLLSLLPQFKQQNTKRERKNKIKPTLSNFHTIPHSFLHLKLRSFFTLSLILYDDVSKQPLPTPLTTTTTAHHYRFRRPSDHASEPNSSNPDSYPHCLKSRTTGNLFSLPLKPSPPQMHEAEHDDTDDVVQKPWNLRPRKPTHLPKAALEIGTGPSRNHQQLKDSRKDSDYEKLWKPPSNHGFIPCTKPTPLNSWKVTWLPFCSYKWRAKPNAYWVLYFSIWPQPKSFSDEGFGPIPKRWHGIYKQKTNFTATVVKGVHKYGPLCRALNWEDACSSSMSCCRRSWNLVYSTAHLPLRDMYP